MQENKLSGNWVIFDMDDVLVNLRDVLYPHLSEKTGLDIHWNEWFSYYLGEVFGIEKEEVKQLISEQEILEKVCIEPYVREVFEIIKSYGLKVGILTARGWHKNGEFITNKWLYDHGVNVDNLSLVQSGAHKKEVLKLYENVVLFIDDHYENLDDAIELNINTLLINRPWNKCSKNHPRADNLMQVIDRLKAISIFKEE